MKMTPSRLIAVLIIALAGAALAQSSQQAAPAQVKIPQTPEDHFALAKRYQEQAAANRQLAAEHRAMAEEYKKSIAPPTKAGPNPYGKKMEAHCLTIAKDAEKLAADADKAAEFHTLRGKELQGK